MTYEDARTTLKTCGQEHALRHWAALNEMQREALLDQIATLDPALVAELSQSLGAGDETGTSHPDIEPADVVRLAQQPATRADARARGEQALRDGKVGVILVAGGQGTRLGFDGPKGAYPLGPITNMTLFDIHARKILALERLYQTNIPFYVMTSQTNDAATRAFFTEHDGFGLAPENVRFFIQGMLPAFDADGKIVLDAPDHLFLSPDGHGGTLSALAKTGNLDDMKQRGLSTLFYFQVDNALVQVADPEFIGRHLAADADMSLKVCAKRDPEEGLGMVVKKDGGLAVVEYTELTREQKYATRPDGELKFLFGSVAIHVFSREFLAREADAGLPFHRAFKKVPFCDEHGRTVTPEQPNAYKFEKFIFDALPDARNALLLEFARGQEFSPLKNAAGADSAEAARRDMMSKWAGWLEQAGIPVPRDARNTPVHKLEIDPCYAVSAEELKAKLPAGFRVDGDLHLR